MSTQVTREQMAQFDRFCTQGHIPQGFCREACWRMWCQLIECDELDTHLERMRSPEAKAAELERYTLEQHTLARIIEEGDLEAAWRRMIEMGMPQRIDREWDEERELLAQWYAFYALSLKVSD